MHGALTALSDSQLDAVEALKEWAREDHPVMQVAAAEKWGSSRQAEIQSTNARVLSYDWTYTTPYAGHVVSGGGEDAASAPAAPAWRPSEQKVDRAMLMTRDPIIFYEEVPLYESELDDHGVSQMHVKVGGAARCLVGYETLPKRRWPSPPLPRRPGRSG